LRAGPEARCWDKQVNSRLLRHTHMLDVHQASVIYLQPGEAGTSCSRAKLHALRRAADDGIPPVESRVAKAVDVASHDYAEHRRQRGEAGSSYDTLALRWLTEPLNACMQRQQTHLRRRKHAGGVVNDGAGEGIAAWRCNGIVREACHRQAQAVDLDKL